MENQTKPGQTGRLRRWGRRLLVLVILFLVVEPLALAYILVKAHRGGHPMAGYVQQFLLSRLLVKPFMDQSAPLFQAPQPYKGNIDPRRGAHWRDMYPVDGLLGWRNAPNIKITHSRDYSFILNDQGFVSTGALDFHIDRAKPTNVCRVIVLGGSTVFGIGANTPDQSLPAQVDRWLQTLAPGPRPYEVINAGVGGYSSGHEYMYLMTELADFNPDILVVYDGWNDMAYGNRMLGALGERWIPLKSATHYEMEQRVRKTYSFWGTFGLLLKSLRSSLDGSFLSQFASWELLTDQLIKLKYKLAKPPPETLAYAPRSVEIYRRHLENMVDIARQRGFKISLFLQPIMGVGPKPYTPAEQRLLLSEPELQRRAQFYADARAMLADLQRQYAGQAGVCITDVSQVFSNVAETVYADSGHLQARGNDLVAQAMVERLRACGFVPPTP